MNASSFSLKSPRTRLKKYSMMLFSFENIWDLPRGGGHDSRCIMLQVLALESSFAVPALKNASESGPTPPFIWIRVVSKRWSVGWFTNWSLIRFVVTGSVFAAWTAQWLACRLVAYELRSFDECVDKISFSFPTLTSVC